MDTRTTRKYEMLMRAWEFGADHQELFPAGSLGAETLGELREILAEITNQDVARRGAVGEGQNVCAESRTALARTLNRIHQTSRLLADEQPAVGDSFPRWDGRRSNRTLLQTARSYATDAAPLADGFIAHGMPATMMADLQAEIDRFAAALDSRQRARVTKGEARNRIRQAIGRGQLAVRRLTAFLTNTREHGDPQLAVWQELRRIGPEARSRKPRGTPTTPASGGAEPVPTGVITTKDAA